MSTQTSSTDCLQFKINGCYTVMAEGQNYSTLDAKKCITKLDQQSRNILILLSEYLTFIQLVVLTNSNKKIKVKLDNFQQGICHDSYFKKRAILHFQSFFFQQFSASEQFYQRMSSMTSNSTTASSCFLPLSASNSFQLDKPTKIQDKQPSLNSIKNTTCDSRQSLCQNSRIQCLDLIGHNYLEETYMMWQQLYFRAVNNRTIFVQKHKDNFYSAFVQDADDYAKEIFQDPSLCENPCFVLPSLTRENYTQKDLFYRTEKVLVQNFYNCFQNCSVDYTKKILWDVNQENQQHLSSDYKKQQVLKALLTDYNDQDFFLSPQLMPGSRRGTQHSQDFYLEEQEEDEIMQYSELQNALDSLKMPKDKHMQGSATYSDFLDLNEAKNLNLLSSSDDISVLHRDICSYSLRKISQNFIVQESFQETMLKENVLTKADITKHSYVSDYLLLEFLDAIWINEVYKPHMHTLVEVAKEEIAAVHTLDRFSELQEKKSIFKKVINLMHQMEYNFENSNCLMHIANLDNEGTFCQIKQYIGKPDNKENCCSLYEGLLQVTLKSVRALLKQMYNSATSVEEFAQLTKLYELLEFWKMSEVELFYINTKKNYMVKSFTKELVIKLEGNKYMQNTKDGIIRGLLKQEDFKQYLDFQELIHSLFVLFHIESKEKSQFIYHANSMLIELHDQIQQLNETQTEEEVKMEEENQERAVVEEHASSLPLGLSQVSDEDDLSMDVITQPELIRGYSAQKSEVIRGMSRIILRTIKQVEEVFDFKELIQQRKQDEQTKMINEIQQRINFFNQSMSSFTEHANEAEDMFLPDPTSLALPQFNFASSPGNGQISRLQRTSNTFNFHIEGLQQVNNK